MFCISMIYDQLGHQHLHICFQTMNFKRGNYRYYIISIISFFLLGLVLFIRHPSDTGSKNKSYTDRKHIRIYLYFIYR